MPRLLRDSPLNGIWEGSGNVISLDLLRALAREPDGLPAGAGAVGPGLAVRTAVGLLAAAGPAEHDWRHEVHRPRPMKGEVRSGDGIPLRFEARGFPMIEDLDTFNRLLAEAIEGFKG